MRKTILIIDDDEVFGNETAELLRDAGYHVLYGSDRQEAISLIRKNRFHLCLLDYKMEDINGVELLKEINRQYSGCLCLIISGKPLVQKTLEEEHVSHLVAGVIQKPFQGAYFLKTIDNLLSTGADKKFLYPTDRKLYL